MTAPVFCRDCRFWDDRKTVTEGIGQCRRMPPQPNGDDSRELIPDAQARWPTTEQDDWCAAGERKTP